MKLSPYLCLFASVCAIATPSSAFDVQVESYPPAPRSPVLCVPHTDKPPVLDGKLDDAAWKKATVIERLGLTDGSASPMRTTVRALFDEKNLYLAFDCEEPHMDRLRVKGKEGEDRWPDNCVEVFLDVGRTREHFYQLVTSQRDAHNDYLDAKLSWNGKWRSKSAPTADGWAVEYSIPWSDFGLDQSPAGQVWGFNVTREREVAPKGDSPSISELSTWVPMESFANARLYGGIFFGTQAQFAERAEPLTILGTLDRFVYNTYQPRALLALELTSGKADGTTVALHLKRRDDDETVGKASVPITSSRTGIDLPIEGLPPGQYTVVAFATDKHGQRSNSLVYDFELRKGSDTPQSGKIAIQQTIKMNSAVPLWHVRTGVPFPEGALTNANQVTLLSSDGKPLPVHAHPLATWSKGGSVKWLGLDFQLPLVAGQQTGLTLRYGGDAKRVDGGQVRVEQNEKTIMVDTGAAKFEIRRRGFNLTDKMWVGGKQLLADGEARGPYMDDESGKRFWSHLDSASEVTVEEQGPMKTVIKAAGAHADGSGKLLGRYLVRLYFYSGLPYFRLQHTFIIAENTDKTRYSDIGVLFPLAGTDYRFGLPTGEPYSGALDGKTTVSLLQRRWNDFVVKANASEPKQLAQGDKAPGWFARGNVAVVVRDCWQNFPKELEATRDGLIVHLWPSHGERVWTPEQEISVEEAWRLPFVHQGKILDFKVPDPYFTGPLAKAPGFARPDGKGGWNLFYGDGAKLSNAQGVGKTHDMLVAFGEAAQPESIRALNEAFQADVHFLADPKWTCNTSVVGEMAAFDPQKFPRQEEIFSDGFDFLMRWTLGVTRAYGMFNYGDSFHGIQGDSPILQPTYERMWAGMHHGRARIPWLLYLRSGDPKYFHWGRANAQRLIDMSICHFASSHAETGGAAAARKAVGGLCDYKGFVPWHNGSRIGDYNNMIDFMLLDYYLTGNRRQLDVIHEVGQALTRLGKAFPSREGAGFLSSLLDYYKATWDASALLVFVNELPRMYDIPAIDHGPPSIGWAPYLEPWIDYSSDPRAKRFLLESVADFMDPTKSLMGFNQYGDGRVLATAYALTGDKKYLYHAWGYYNQGPGLYSNTNDIRNHYVNWLPYSFETQQCLPLMAELAKLPQLPTMDQPRYTSGRGGVGVRMLSSKGTGEFSVVVPEKVDQEFRIGNRFFTRQDLQYEVTAPSGKIIQTGIVPAVSGAYFMTLIQPRDGLTGEYKLRIFGPDEFQFETSAVSSLGTERFLVPTLTNGEFNLQGRLFFHVPSDCEKFSITLRGSPSHNASFEIIGPDDRMVRHVSIPRTSAAQTIELTPSADSRGKVWSLATDGCPLVGVQGIAPWFAATVQGAQAGLNGK